MVNFSQPVAPHEEHYFKRERVRQSARHPMVWKPAETSSEFESLYVSRILTGLTLQEDFGKEVLELRNLDKTVIANRYILGHLQVNRPGDDAELI